MLKLARLAMRTRFEIVLADGADPAHLRAAGEEALDEIERIEAWLSAFKPESELSSVNAHAASRPIRVSAPFFKLLEDAAMHSEHTRGAFDMSVAPLLRYWQGISSGTGVVDETERTQAHALVGMQNLCLDSVNSTVRFSKNGVCLDPGAIGKGYAIERAANILREAGIQSALLHGGTSTVCAIGAPPGNSAWVIAIQHPARRDALLARAMLHDRSLSVSAVHGKTFWAAGRRFGHVIDPRSGWPVKDTLLAACVADSATETDALSTALLVLGLGTGSDGASALVENYPTASVLVASQQGTTDEVSTMIVGQNFCV